MWLLASDTSAKAQSDMIVLTATLCLAALLGALTVLGLMVLFLALCVVMRAIGFALSTEFDELKKLKLPR
jgi:hypothetical protein